MIVQNNESTPIFLKIKNGEKETVGYLLGSVHRVPDDLWLNEYIMECFKKSARFAPEIIVSKHHKLFSTLAWNSWNEKFQNLSYKQIYTLFYVVAQFFPDNAKDVDTKNLDAIKSFLYLRTLQLETEVWKKAGMTSGIDSTLERQASDRGIPISELESPNEPERLQLLQEDLAQDSLKNQLLDNLLTVDLEKLEGNAPEIKEKLIEKLAQEQKIALQPLLDGWKEGNLEFLKDSARGNSIRTVRNANIAKKIAELVSKENRVFCCIGAAHTVGDNSVQTFLANYGLNTQ